MDIRFRTALLMGLTSLAMISALTIGFIQSNQLHSSFYPAIYSVINLDRQYCITVGDDNCDGMIVTTESGWKCVPLKGGPLTCVIKGVIKGVIKDVIK